MGFDMKDARKLLDKDTAEALEIIQDPSRVDEILAKLEAKLKEVPYIGETLADLPLMISMVKAWITKEYAEVSPKVIACLVGAILYLLKRQDLIPDKTPIVGYADDLGVVLLALKLSEPELRAFSEWRAAKTSVQS